MSAEIFQRLVFHGCERIPRHAKKKLKSDYLRLICAATEAAMKQRGLKPPRRPAIWRQARRLRVTVECIPPEPMWMRIASVAQAVAGVAR